MPPQRCESVPSEEWSSNGLLLKIGMLRRWVGVLSLHLLCLGPSDILGFDEAESRNTPKQYDTYSALSRCRSAENRSGTLQAFGGHTVVRVLDVKHHRHIVHHFGCSR